MIVRIRGIKRVRAKGRIYHYHRATNQRIKADPADTAAFMREIEALDGQATAAPAAQRGTLGGLAAAYRASPEFTNLAPRTRADYQAVFDYLKPFDALGVEADLTTPRVLAIRDKAYGQRKRRFANYVVQVLRLVMTWGKPRGWVEANTAAGVPLIKRPKGARKVNRPWADGELAVALERASGGMRVAIALGAYACLREGNVVRFAKSGYDGYAVQADQEKTDEPVWVPAHSVLKAILDARLAEERQLVAKGKPDTLMMVLGERGKPYRTTSGFRTMFFRFIRELEALGLVQPGLTFHGLRHTIPTILANLGASKGQIKPLTGQKSDASVAIYTETADRQRLAKSSMEMLERHHQQTLQDKGSGQA